MKKSIFVYLLLFCSTVFADQVTLTNGDRLTGVIRKYDDQKLYLKTDFADEIAIKWSSIAKVTGDKPLHVERSDDSKLTAPALEASGTDVTVEAATPVTVPAKDIKNIRSDSEQLAYEQSLHPDWWHAWHGGGNLGFALARGNSDTTNLSIGFTADRKTVRDKTSMYFNSVYSTDGLLGLTTANALRGGIRYDRDINKKIFGYGSGDFEHDALQDLTIRAILGAGLGLHAINSFEAR